MSVDEFKKGIEMSCKGKSYNEVPAAFRFFIDSCFRTIDVDGKACRRTLYETLPEKKYSKNCPKFVNFETRKTQNFDGNVKL